MRPRRFGRSQDECVCEAKNIADDQMKQRIQESFPCHAVNHELMTRRATCSPVILTGSQLISGAALLVDDFG